MMLEDMSGCLNAYAWKEEVYRNEPVKDLSCLYVEGQLRKRSDETVADIVSLDMTDKTKDAVRLIPHSLCPQPWLMSVLEAAVSRFTILPLKKFVESVFADDSIAFAFVSAPASFM